MLFDCSAPTAPIISSRFPRQGCSGKPDGEHNEPERLKKLNLKSVNYSK